MSESMHEKARRLMAQEHVEGISAADGAWLGEHLRACEACANAGRELGSAIGTLRGFRVDLPKGLASRTQMRVQLRAMELRGREPGRRMLWLIAGVSWALGIATGPWVWSLFEWAGTALRLPKPLWETGVVLWWALPALVAVAVVLLDRKPASDSNGSGV